MISKIIGDSNLFFESTTLYYTFLSYRTQNDYQNNWRFEPDFRVCRVWPRLSSAWCDPPDRCRGGNCRACPVSGPAFVAVPETKFLNVTIVLIVTMFVIVTIVVIVTFVVFIFVIVIVLIFLLLSDVRY